MAKITTVRLADPLKERALAYAEGLGISLNALMAVALKDYLDTRERRPKEAQPQVKVSATIPKVGRNERCPCGSGKKYKLCHGR